MSNFLQETIKVITENRKETNDVSWVGSADGKYATSWNNFCKMADRDEEELSIQHNLVVVGSNWWLERDNDGYSESWWVFKSIPKPMLDFIVFNEISGSMFEQRGIESNV